MTLNTTLQHHHIPSMGKIDLDQIGIHPLRIVVWGNAETPLIKHAVSQLLDANIRNGGVNAPEPQSGDLVLFPAKGGIKSEENGLFGLPSNLRKGIKGVAVASTDTVSSETDLLQLAWTTLANKATQYGVLFVGDETTAECHRAFIFSMEGSHVHIEREKRSEGEFFDKVIARLTHLAGAEVVSNWEVDYSMPVASWQNTTVPNELIETGHKMRAWNHLPDIRLEHYASPKRAGQVQLYLEVTGLTTGNMSAWDDSIGAMQITGSGVDKGNLSRDQVVAIKGLNAVGNGTIVWAPEGTRRVKPSVEAFDHVLTYSASGLMLANKVSKYDLTDVVRTLNSHDLAERARGLTPFFKSLIHLHLWPQRAFKPERVHIVDVDPRLYTHHSSCGTRPLAIYSVEALLRGMVESSYADKMFVVGLPNHGLLAAAPYSLSKMTDLFDPADPALDLIQVPTT